MTMEAMTLMVIVVTALISMKKILEVMTLKEIQILVSKSH
jgi:hypothetical protein